MPTVIRRNVFETNSSSTHSISINTDDYIPDQLPLENGICKIYQGEFGWEQNVYNDAATKASYIWTDVKEQPDKQDMLRECIAEVCHLNPEDIKLMEEPAGYIDHQSYGTTESALSSKENLKAFIFNVKSVLETDNDNH